MRTPNEFDYDLWRTTEGRNMIRLKNTGETMEVSDELMAFLRAEENRIRHQMRREKNLRTLSLDWELDSTIGDINSSDSTWLCDQHDYIDEANFEMMTEEFSETLTAAQRSIFEECLLHGRSLTQYAAQRGITLQAVQNQIKLIRKKAKKFLE